MLCLALQYCYTQGCRKDFWSGPAVIGACFRACVIFKFRQKVVWPKPDQPDRLLHLYMIHQVKWIYSLINDSTCKSGASACWLTCRGPQWVCFQSSSVSPTHAQWLPWWQEERCTDPQGSSKASGTELLCVPGQTAGEKQWYTIHCVSKVSLHQF